MLGRMYREPGADQDFTYPAWPGAEGPCRLRDSVSPGTDLISSPVMATDHFHPRSMSQAAGAYLAGMHDADENHRHIFLGMARGG
jgi:hypothetical protein